MDILQAIVVSALTSSVLAAGINVGFNVWEKSRERERSVAFLALLVSTILYRYADELWGIVADNDFHASSRGMGTEHYQVPPPPPFPEMGDVAWRAMPADLLTRCMEFPDEVMAGRRAIEFYLELNGPDGDECVEQATGLALKALDLAVALREQFRWPAHEMRFDYRKRLESKQNEVDARREMRQEVSNQESPPNAS